MSTFSHHGIIYVPLGYSQTFAQATSLTEAHGGMFIYAVPASSSDRLLKGSPWGAGTLAGPDGSRQPSELELEVATIQGKQFYGVVSKAF